MKQRPILSRPMLIMLLAVGGVVLAAQTRVITERFGAPTYFVLIGLVAVGLATLARRK